MLTRVTPANTRKRNRSQLVCGRRIVCAGVEMNRRHAHDELTYFVPPRTRITVLEYTKCRMYFRRAPMLTSTIFPIQDHPTQKPCKWFKAFALDDLVWENSNPLLRPARWPSDATALATDVCSPTSHSDLLLQEDQDYPYYSAQDSSPVFSPRRLHSQAPASGPYGSSPPHPIAARDSHVVRDPWGAREYSSSCLLRHWTRWTRLKCRFPPALEVVGSCVSRPGDCRPHAPRPHLREEPLGRGFVDARPRRRHSRCCAGSGRRLGFARLLVWRGRCCSHS